MVTYEMKQSENGLAKAYSKFMETLSEHITLLARNGRPITSVMAIKRVLYRFRKQLTLNPSVLLTSPLSSFAKATADKKGRSDCVPDESLALLVSEVMDKFDIDISDAVKFGMTEEKALKRVLIKFDYEQMAKQGIKYKDIKRQLSEQYGWSVSSIEKLVYGK